MEKTIAIVRLWPGLANAELENTHRIKRAAEELGISVIEVDKNGYYIEDPTRELRHGEVDFVIHLHFETPKTYDAFSYVALWNPLRFFVDWGYERFSKNLISHDGFLSCGSEWADDHVRRLLWARHRPAEESFASFNHTVSSPLYSPVLLGSPKVFYAGINWERLASKGRHDTVFRLLDGENILRIYGPESVRGVKVWKGFKSYCGAIPFDGHSLIDEIAKCGVSLVLSSDAHAQSGLMSNRLFESLAAGAVVISDDNPFARRNFGSTLLYIDYDTKAQHVADQIRRHWTWVASNPDQALELAKAAQQIFLDKYGLKAQLANIVESHKDRMEWVRNNVLSSGEKVRVTVVVPLFDVSVTKLDTVKENLLAQSYNPDKVLFLVDKKASEQAIGMVSGFVEAFAAGVEVIRCDLFYRGRRNAMGNIVASLDPKEGPVIVMGEGERWFHDHLSSLVRPFEDDENCLVSRSDYILQHWDAQGNEFRDFFVARTRPPHSFEYGTHLFKGSIVSRNQIFFKYLDGRYFMQALDRIGHDGVRLSDRMTYMRDISVLDKVGGVVDEAVQRNVWDECQRAFPIAHMQEVSQDQTYGTLVASYEYLSEGEKQFLSVMTLKNIPLPRPLRVLFLLLYRLITFPWSLRRRSKAR